MNQEPHDDCLAELRRLVAMIHELREECDRMAGMLDVWCYCACCGGVEKCEDGCTIEEDSRAPRAGATALMRYELMVEARAARFSS